MESAADQQTGGDVGNAGLIDLSSIPIDVLLDAAGGDSPVAHALRREQDPGSTELLAAFDSFAG